MAENTLNTVFGYDEHNLGESRNMFRDYGLLDLFERTPGLLESLRLAIEPHLAADPHALGRPDASGALKPRYDTILRVYMHLSAWHQFVMATGHLFRGHVSEVFKDVRRAVEAGGIAYLAKSQPDLGEVFVSGDRDAMRARTTRGKLFPRTTTDPLLQLLGDTWEHASEQSHNNFSSFVARVASNTSIGPDGRAHFKTDFPVYEMQDHGYVLRTAIWVLRAAERVALLLARSFDLPDCDWYRHDLETFRRDLNAACQRLRPLVTPPGAPPAAPPPDRPPDPSMP